MGREIAVWWGADCIVSSLGTGTGENLAALRAGTTRLSSWEDGTPVCRIERGDFDALPACPDTTPVERLAVYALGQIAAQSGVSPTDPRTLVVLSTTKGNIGLAGSDPEKCDLNRTAEVVGRHLHAAHRPLLISNACISGLSAIIIGSRLIRSGAYDHVFVAGFDLLCDFIVSGFNAFKSTSPTLCRPYDAARDGLTLGEGCGAVLLTRDPALSETGITVAGGGISNDANHISAPSRTGDGLWYAIRAALGEAGIGSEQIGLVNPHGTATLYNDEMESRALHLAGLCDTPCNSLKPYFGHTLGASGIVESIVTVHELCEGVCFGVKGYAACGVPYPLNISASNREIRTDAALKTASGFGGCNAAVVFRRGAGNAGARNGLPGTDGTHGAAYDTHGVDAPHGAADTGNGVPCRDTAHAALTRHPSLPFDAFIRERYRALGERNLKFSKMDDLCKLAYVVSCELLAQRSLPYPPERIGVVMANRSASLDSDRRHQAIIDAGDPCGASPAVFVFTLPNIMLGQVAIRHGLKGESTFLAFPDKSANFIRKYAASLIADGRMDAVVWGWCELLDGDYDCELTLTEKTE